MGSNNNQALYFFHQGTNYSAYNYLGCNVSRVDGKYLYSFRTWAPNADSVALIGDFVSWDIPQQMCRISSQGIWEFIYTSDVSLEKQAYKFRITSKGKTFDKGDPYARFSRGRDDGASLIYCSDSFKWQDKMWLKHRKNTVRSKDETFIPAPINIYEIHFSSFIRHDDDNSYYTYREMAEILVPYVKAMGYTHVEFLPLAEYPFDGSWGYQVCGFYAPTSRFGEPDDFRYLINELHKNGIGVIMDWVPAHFPKDAWGLYEFDGQPLYEYQGEDRQESRSWGTRFFDLGREEVQSFLVSNALYFLREFHIDGLRVDAVAAMLYLDFDKDPDKWVKNALGGKENLEAIAFFKKLNSAIFSEMPDVLMIAEESTSYGKVTHPVSDGGLGFNLKWNMGFANDFYDYVQTDPLFRKYKHKALNFPIVYAFSENYVLPISHDEVVHGKLSFINKMHGSYEDKFKQMRASLLYIMTFPGKKMLFMGTEYGPFREWDFDNSLEWFMLDYDKHRYMRDYVRSLNHFYLATPQLWEIDFNSNGFEWLYPNEADKNLVAYQRKSLNSKAVTVIVNFSGAQQIVPIQVPKGKMPVCLFESDGYSIPERFSSPYVISNQRYIDISLAPFSGVVLDITTKKTKKKTK